MNSFAQQQAKYIPHQHIRTPNEVHTIAPWSEVLQKKLLEEEEGHEESPILRKEPKKEQCEPNVQNNSGNKNWHAFVHLLRRCLSRLI